MMYRINEIKLALKEDKKKIPERISEKISEKSGKENSAADFKITDYRIAKESLDARDKNDIKWVYSVDFQTEGDFEKIAEKMKLAKAPSTDYEFVEIGTKPMKNRPIIVGFGPCGMFASLILSEMGYKPLILERGSVVEQRAVEVDNFWKKGILNEDSNVQFGEGGAGTFSDGKLTTQIKNIRIHKVLRELAAAGGGNEILYKQKPHIGTDLLRQVVVNIRKKIIENGGEIRFNTKATGFEIQDGKITGVHVTTGSGQKSELIPTENVVLAIGHSARDTFQVLYDSGINMVQKPFSMGVRIQHKQSLIDKSQYGRSYEELGPADYKLAHRCKNGRGVYTFCMCPGGEVITASSEKEMVVTNGMSSHARDSGYANSALLVDVKTEDFPSEHPLAGVEFQRTYERKAFKAGGGNYKAPSSTWKEFKDSRGAGLKVKESLPDFVTESMLEAVPFLARKLRGFDSPEGIITAVESRSSSPVRILRDESFESNIKGMYPAGEGAGYAGGITSAAVDGIRIAEIIASEYKPYEEQ